MVDCKNNTKRPKKSLATDLWLGHPITRLLVKNEFPIDRHESATSHLIPFTWDSWTTLYAARKLAQRDRLAPSMTEETADTTATPIGSKIPRTKGTPVRAGGSGSRTPRPSSPEYVTGDEHRASIISVTRQLAFSASLQMHMAHKLLGDQIKYEVVLSAVQTDAENHQQQILSALYSPPGSSTVPTPGLVFPATFSRPSTSVAATGTTMEKGDDDDGED